LIFFLLIKMLVSAHFQSTDMFDTSNSIHRNTWQSLLMCCTNCYAA